MCNAYRAQGRCCQPGRAPGTFPEPKEWVPVTTTQISASEAGSMLNEQVDRDIAQGPEELNDSVLIH